MELKFIGKDGSMGLRHGNVYPVRIISLPSDIAIYVQWPIKLGLVRTCPYLSPAAFAANWMKVEDTYDGK